MRNFFLQIGDKFSIISILRRDWDDEKSPLQEQGLDLTPPQCHPYNNNLLL